MKHIPQRMCVSCRAVRPKRSLVRIVRTPQGDVDLDESGKTNGRGAYLCRSRLCWQRAIGDRWGLTGGRLGAALNASLTNQEWAMLWEYAQQLPDVVDSDCGIDGSEIQGE